MFGLKKKENMSELPSLTPSAPSMRDYQRMQFPPIGALNSEENEEIHALPSFPDSPMKRGFSQSAIKSAIGEPDEEESSEMKEWRAKSPPTNLSSIASTPKTTNTIEMDEWTPDAMLQPKSEMRLPPPPMSMQMPSSMRDSKRPLFVKLDKFKEAKESLIRISEKLEQMDELLKMIKDIKAKEDVDLNSWARDMENIKARIALVNKEIFENAY